MATSKAKLDALGAVSWDYRNRFTKISKELNGRDSTYSLEKVQFKVFK